MRRRDFMVFTCGAVLARPLATVAQARTYRLGFLATTAEPLPEFQALFDALAKLGYREGENLIVERRFAAGDDRRLRPLAAELVRSSVDVIVTQSSTATKAAAGASATIPIVMGSTADALGGGLVASLAHPGGNVTGMNFLARDWEIKHLDLLLALRPQATRLGFLANFSFLPEPPMYRDLREEAARRGVSMLLYDIRRTEEYERAFASMAEARIEGLAVAPNAGHREHRQQLAALAMKFRLPAIYGSRDMVEAGGLLSYGVDFPDLWRKAAGFVDRIFKGAKPADLPVEQPTKFELVINLKTAKALDIAIPQALLVSADDVIE